MSDMATRVRRLAASVCLGALTALGACGGVSAPQLRAYSDAFSQARDGGEQIYAALVPAAREYDKVPAPPMLFPLSLGARSFHQGGCAIIIDSADETAAARAAGRAPGDPRDLFDALKARCLTLTVVTRYNDLLLSLAAGPSAAEVRYQAANLQRAVNALAPLAVIPQAGGLIAAVNVFLPPLKMIVEQAATLADQAALRAKLEEGAEPVNGLIEALRLDVPKIYDVQYRYAQLLLTRIDGQITPRINSARQIAAARAPATDPAVIAFRRTLDDRFDALFAKPEPRVRPALRELSDRTKPALDIAAALTIAAALDETAPLVDRFHAVADEWSRFLAALRSYEKVLASVHSAFQALVHGARDPLAPGGAVAQVTVAATTIQEQVAEIRRLLAK